jgi:DNA-directed RNA polymerase specialized sigma24 family protein
MESYDKRFEGIDLGKLLEDLCRFVTRRFHREFRNQSTVLRGNAFSAQDLVHEALTKFIIKNVGWQAVHPENPQADMFRFVRRIVHNGFLDLVKDGRAYKRTQSSDDIEIEESPEGFEEDSISDVLIRDLTDAKITKRAYESVKGEPELIEYLRCVLQ